MHWKAENDKKMKNERLYDYKNTSRNKEHFKKKYRFRPRILSRFIWIRGPWGRLQSYNILWQFQKVIWSSVSFIVKLSGFIEIRKKLKVTAINQLFVYLVWLRNVFTLQHLTWLFDISIPIASRSIITSTNFLYFKLGNVPV